MEYRTLGNTDLKVSSIGLGCVTFGREIDEATSFTVMDHALERGITLFDTAEAYAKGRSEEVVGQWLKARGRRDQIVLATKVTPPLDEERILAAAEASLRRLQTDVIDLYQLHAFDPKTPLEATLAALNKLVEQGKVRYLGCSNFAAWQLCKALWEADANGWPRLESVQPNYNLAVRDIEAELLPCCADQEIGVITYSPLGAGFLTGKYTRSKTAPAGTRFDLLPSHWSIYDNEVAFQRMEKLRTKAEQTGRPMVDLALSWVMGQPGVTSVLIGCRSTAHVDQAFVAEQTGLPLALRAEMSSW
ncbi:MAG: aldo/keto reductase [Chloroflexi bacterium]|nr:MAG: aldo/keto reductase [Chloroflexota bacterium]